jgi:hypothetical protein
MLVDPSTGDDLVIHRWSDQAAYDACAARTN